MDTVVIEQEHIYVPQIENKWMTIHNISALHI